MPENPKAPIIAKAPKTANDGSDNQEGLDIEALAAAILTREIRPRVGSVRRLAEAVLARGQKPAKPEKTAKKKKKSSGKKCKQAKIPGQKKDQRKAG